MPSRTACLSKKGCGFATPECRAQRDVAVHPRPAPPPPLLAAPRLSTTALGDLEIRWVVWPGSRPPLTRVAGACYPPAQAPVAELVDAPDSKSGFRKEVLVRLRPGAPRE